MATDPSIWSILTHRITIVPPSTNVEGGALTDVFGETAQGEADHELIPCFINLKTQRTYDKENRITVFGATITLPAEVEIALDWEVRDGVDTEGNILIKAGRVEELDVVQDPDAGSVAKIIRVVLR